MVDRTPKSSSDVPTLSSSIERQTMLTLKTLQQLQLKKAEIFCRCDLSTLFCCNDVVDDDNDDGNGHNRIVTP